MPPKGDAVEAGAPNAGLEPNALVAAEPKPVPAELFCVVDAPKPEPAAISDVLLEECPELGPVIVIEGSEGKEGNEGRARRLRIVSEGESFKKWLIPKFVPGRRKGSRI